MIYPVVIKKISVPSGRYCADDGVRYIAFSPLTETIFAMSDTVQDVLKKITAEFALRVFDNQAEIDIIIVDDRRDISSSYEIFNTEQS